jgi:hypothetical protein
VIVPVFVDDITLASKSKTKIQDIKQELAKHFELQDLGPTTFQLGVEIICDRPNRTLHLSGHCHSRRHRLYSGSTVSLHGKPWCQSLEGCQALVLLSSWNN